MKLLNTSLSKVLALTAIVLGGLVVNYLTIAWTGPTATAPDGNEEVPIHTGGSQIKSGSLGVDGLLVDGRMHITNGVIQRGGNTLTATSDLGLYSQVSGNWMRFVTNNAPFKFFADNGIGTNPVMTITANSQVHANEFCDRNGNNCKSPASMGGSISGCQIQYQWKGRGVVTPWVSTGKSTGGWATGGWAQNSTHKLNNCAYGGCGIRMRILCN